MKQLQRNRYTIDALARGLELLALFSAARPHLTLSEIVSALGMNKSTVYRVVTTLESLGFLEHDAATRRYRPGLAVLELGFAALSSLEIRQIAHPQLERLAEECNETASLAVLDRDGRDIVYIDRVRNRAIVGIVLGVGSRVPAHTTSLGKALLAHFSEAALATWLDAAPPRALTEQTLTSHELLMADLEATRLRGYALSDQELAMGLRGAAAAIRDHSGNAIAAISVSGPTATLTLERIETQIGPAVVAAAAQISRALGG